MPESSDEKQNKPWLFKKGQSGNPAGRPKGTIGLKTWAKEYLSSLTEEERMDFMDGLPKIDIWKMAEGNPQSDVTSGGEKIAVNLVSFDENGTDTPQPEAPEAKG